MGSDRAYWKHSLIMHFGRYSFPVPHRVRRPSWLEWMVTYRDDTLLTLSLPDRKNIISPKTVENSQYRR